MAVRAATGSFTTGGLRPKGAVRGEDTDGHERCCKGRSTTLFVCLFFSKLLSIAYMHEPMGTSGRNYWTGVPRESGAALAFAQLVWLRTSTMKVDL